MRLSIFIILRILLIGLQIFGITAILFAAYSTMNYDVGVAHMWFSASPERIAAENARLHTDVSVYQQFWNFWGNFSQGTCKSPVDLISEVLGQKSCHHTYGVGWERPNSGTPIDYEIRRTSINSLVLFIPAIIIYSLLGVALGFYAGLKNNGFTDFTLRTTTNLGAAIPAVIVAIYVKRFLSNPSEILSDSLAAKLHWMQLVSDDNNKTQLGRIDPYRYIEGLFNSIVNGSNGYTSPYEESYNFGYLWFLIVIMAFLSTPYLFRLIRTITIAETKKPYVRTARAKGLRESYIIFYHILPNILPKIINAIAITIPIGITAAAVTEYLFDYQGLARYMAISAFNVDIPVLIAGSVQMVIFTAIIMMIADVLGEITNPKAKRQSV